MAEKNYGNNSQLAELVKYISDEMKFPIMGAGGGFAPIGTINFFDATVAPLGWLACDGSTHNISDYPDLATFYASVHGASNFYGGNGTTTFAVPNLQGEFLRGAGTNGHTNQGDGGEVGEHQDGTKHLSYYSGATSLGFYDSRINSTNNTNNPDSKIAKSTNNFRYATSSTPDDSETFGYFTSRPTNTSFLICIKATLSDTELNNMHVYSPNERQVGWWQEMQSGVLKQKPVWEVTITSVTVPNGVDVNVGTIEDIEKLVDASALRVLFKGSKGLAKCPDGSSNIYVDTNDDMYFYQNTSGQGVFDFVIRYIKTTDEWQTV